VASAEQVNWLDALVSADGQRLLARLAGEQVGPATALALVSALRREYPANLVAAALTQTELRERARPKFGRADQMYFTRAGLEQASSEQTAAHRARRYAGLDRLADLCCGIGGDLVSLAAGHVVLAVDRDPLHLRLAHLNAASYGVADRVTSRCADVREVDLTGIAGVFVDPARRTADRRLPTGASEPPLAWCFGLAERVPAVGIKAAPGLPRELVPPGWELELIADGYDLKEAALWSPSLATATRRATILPEGHTLVASAGLDVPVLPPGAYLIDPNPAVTRAGLVEDLARLVGAWKIDQQVAFLSSDVSIQTPFGRTLQIEASLPWGLKELRKQLRMLDVGAVDIRKRGSAVDVDVLHHGLRLAGRRRAIVALTRVADRPWAFVCTPSRGGGDGVGEPTE
jgi:hypothetical protein